MSISSIRAIRWGAVGALVATMACATSSSSDSINGMRMYMQPKTLLWEAAVVSMHDIGARIIVSNEASGLLAGEVRRGELGGGVRLDVTVRSSSRMPGEERRTGSDISVSVIYEGGIPDDPGLQGELRDLRDEYLETVEMNLGVGSRRRLR